MHLDRAGTRSRNVRCLTPDVPGVDPAGTHRDLAGSVTRVAGMTLTTSPERSTSPQPVRRRRWRWLIAGALLILALGGAFVWWFLRDDAPDAVDIGDAAAQV